MDLSKAEIRKVLETAKKLNHSTPAQPVEDFISGILGLNPVQRVDYFPSPDPDGSLSIAIAHLTGERERLLCEECIIPSFAVFNDPQGKFFIAGLRTYLEAKSLDVLLCDRLMQYSSIRTALRSIRIGHDLEALAAAIMSTQCDYGEATCGSGDQGIDAIGWKRLVSIDPCFVDGDFSKPQHYPGEKVFLFASSKAFTDGKDTPPKVINPAHIRELVGGWVIQRSSASQWQSVGIRMLSPVQMVLVTTYRLSLNAKLECRTLGVQVWGIPELIYLICIAAPESVFDPNNGHAFSRKNFNTWWSLRNTTKLMKGG